jgi:hypothetical protein
MFLFLLRAGDGEFNKRDYATAGNVLVAAVHPQRTIRIFADMQLCDHPYKF